MNDKYIDNPTSIQVMEVKRAIPIINSLLKSITPNKATIYVNDINKNGVYSTGFEYTPDINIDSNCLIHYNRLNAFIKDCRMKLHGIVGHIKINIGIPKEDELLENERKRGIFIEISIKPHINHNITTNYKLMSISFIESFNNIIDNIILEGKMKDLYIDLLNEIEEEDNIC